MTKKSLLFLVTTLFLFSLYGEISFGKPDLNKDDELLFTVNQKNVGSNPYNSLFFTKLKDGKTIGSPEVITCYPEQMELLENANVLQIRNRYGTASYSAKTDSITWTETLDEIPEQTFPTAPYAVSPNGQYLCKIEKDSLLTGDLILQEVKTGKTSVLARDVLLSYKDLPVKWAPDSTILLYEKQGDIYFCNPEAIFREVEVEERYRKIGRGTINSVEWASSKYIAYIDDYILYRIGIKELYTLGLYSGIMGQGKPMGRLPFQFDSKTDKFSPNTNVSAVVVTQNSRLFTYLTVQKESCDYMDVVYSRPYTDSTASLVNSYVFWDRYGNPILWQEKLPYDGYSVKCSVYKLSSDSKKLLEIQNSGKPEISPDKNKIAFYAGSTVYVYDITTWRRLGELTGEKIISLLWKNNTEIYAGGEKSIRKWDTLANTSQVITLSSANAAYWINNNEIMADGDSTTSYKYNRTKKTWAQEKNTITKSPSTQNGRYRVFLGTTRNSMYKNALYVRTLGKEAVTKPVFPKSVEKVPEQKKVALIFDFYDNSDGLPEILSTLKKYNVPGTFFLNGEFIRRYPSETKQIVANGYPCGSMFFTPVNLAQNTFVINEDFIRRGLARNEDEFYDCTGKELSLFWHSPFYQITESGKEYGQNAGYTYVQPQAQIQEFQGTNNTPEYLIETIMTSLNRAQGGVVPVVGGFSKGYHVDPLYNYLDILISSLIQSGYQLVTVEELH